MRLAHVERQASALRDAGEAIAVRLGTERGHFVDQLDVALASLDDEPPGLRAYRDRFLKRQERGLGGDPKEAAQVMDVVLAALVALRDEIPPPPGAQSAATSSQAASARGRFLDRCRGRA